MVSVVDCGPIGRLFESASQGKLAALTFPQWSMIGLGMSSCVCAAGHIKYPVPLIEKSRASCHVSPD